MVAAEIPSTVSISIVLFMPLPCFARVTIEGQQPAGKGDFQSCLVQPVKNPLTCRRFDASSPQSGARSEAGVLRGTRHKSCVESGLTFRFGGKATRATAVIGRRKEAVSPEQQAELRRQRLILTVAGSIAFSGLAILAYNYTAPFADPPSFAVSAQATAAVPRVVVAEPERPAVESSEVAAEPVERVTLAPEPAFETASLPPVTAPVETAAAIEVDIPESDDPRWGSARTAATLSSSEAPAEGGELAYAAGAPAAALKRTVLDDSTDDTET